MTWKAALPMYNVSARLRAGYVALLEALLDQAGATEACGVIERVPDAELPASLLEFWQRPDLLLSQTCGYPWLHALRDQAPLVATPCFDLPGCNGSDYSSVLVVRGDSGIRQLSDARGRVAVASERHSNSGMNALRHAVAPLARDGRFFGAVKWSGSHAASLRMVRKGTADVAAIDCVTYACLRQDKPASVEGLISLGFTASSPGLPIIAGKTVPDVVVRRLRNALLEPEAPLQKAMTALRILRFMRCDEQDYARIARLEEQAIDLGYPELN
jgi:ABC-type phosphate/phosphonate transport system substrate-binding protein